MRSARPTGGAWRACWADSIAQPSLAASHYRHLTRHIPTRFEQAGRKPIRNYRIHSSHRPSVLTSLYTRDTRRKRRTHLSALLLQSEGRTSDRQLSILESVFALFL